MARVHSSLFDPYKLFRFGVKNTPFTPFKSAQLANHSFLLEQQLLQNTWSWLNFQQHVVSDAVHESSRWTTHLIQLSADPITLYRYVRMNWQKPYLSFGSEILTGNRLMTKMMLDTFCTWQKGMSKDCHYPK